MFSQFIRFLTNRKPSLENIYETKIIPPLIRKRMPRSKGPIKTTFELYKESKLPFHLRDPYLRKKAKISAKYIEFLKNREHNAFQLYKDRGQIRIHSLLTRSTQMDRGWFCFVPPNPESENMSNYLYEDREQYEKFIDGNEKYPCCEEFSKVPRKCEFFPIRKPGKCGIKVIDKFFQRKDLLAQLDNTQHILLNSINFKKIKKN